MPGPLLVDLSYVKLHRFYCGSKNISNREAAAMILTKLTRNIQASPPWGWCSVLTNHCLKVSQRYFRLYARKMTEMGQCSHTEWTVPYCIIWRIPYAIGTKLLRVTWPNRRHHHYITSWWSVGELFLFAKIVQHNSANHIKFRHCTDVAYQHIPRQFLSYCLQHIGVNVKAPVRLHTKNGSSWPTLWALVKMALSYFKFTAPKCR